jgi:hypothetical protein
MSENPIQAYLPRLPGKLLKRDYHEMYIKPVLSSEYPKDLSGV